MTIRLSFTGHGDIPNRSALAQYIRLLNVAVACVKKQIGVGKRAIEATGLGPGDGRNSRTAARWSAS